VGPVAARVPGLIQQLLQTSISVGGGLGALRRHKPSDERFDVFAADRWDRRRHATLEQERVECITRQRGNW
jgi:hypothetical protein